MFLGLISLPESPRPRPELLTLTLTISLFLILTLTLILNRSDGPLRWLTAQGRPEEAKQVLLQVCAPEPPYDNGCGTFSLFARFDPSCLLARCGASPLGRRA